MANTIPNITIISHLISHDEIKKRFLSAENHFKEAPLPDDEELRSAALKTFELDTELTDSQIDEIFTSAVIKLTYLPEKVQNKLRDAIVNPAVTELDLQNCGLGATEMFLISELLKLTSINELNLWKNPIGDNGAAFIAKCKFLKKLNVTMNNITSHGAIALADISSLHWLDLTRNKIGNVGAKTLANNSSLRWLNLSCNHIGKRGAVALAENTHLLGLDLSGNKFGKDVIQAFIDNNKTLIDINLVGCTLEPSILIELEELGQRNKLRFVEEIIPKMIRAYKETCKNARLISQAQRSAATFRDCQFGALPIEIMLKINDLIVGEDKDYQDLFLEEVKHEHKISPLREESITEHGFFKRDSIHSEALKECLSGISKLKDNMKIVEVEKNSCTLY